MLPNSFPFSKEQDMVTASRLKMTDISRQKRFEADLDGDLTPQHTVGQAIERFVQEKRIPGDGVRFTAISRGVKLDNKKTLGELSESEADWTVMPEVSAG
jgi:hypothetical protein